MYLCLPGWSCQKKIKTWRQQPALVVNHHEQWDWLAHPTDIPPWIPTSTPYTIVTWSMGTWTGLALSHLWQEQPPEKWIALSPFLHLCPTENGQVTLRDLERLLQSYQRNPSSTLKIFSRQQGAGENWQEGQQPHHIAQSLQTLEKLTRPCPFELSPAATKIPLQVEWGHQDRLVSSSTARQFASLFHQVEWIDRPDDGHAIFYETAQEAL